MRSIIAITALLLPLPLLAGGTAPTVPDRFIGYWAGSPTSCGSDADDLILRIGARQISYWESEGPIKAAVTRGDNEIALIAELSGEGETWLATAKFKLSQDGHRLIDDTTIPGQEVVRYRCKNPIGTRSNNSFKPNPLRGSALPPPPEQPTVLVDDPKTCCDDPCNKVDKDSADDGSDTSEPAA